MINHAKFLGIPVIDKKCNLPVPRKKNLKINQSKLFEKSARFLAINQETNSNICIEGRN